MDITRMSSAAPVSDVRYQANRGVYLIHGECTAQSRPDGEKALMSLKKDIRTEYTDCTKKFRWNVELGPSIFEPSIPYDSTAIE
jgi:hypothetical protein